MRSAGRIALAAGQGAEAQADLTEGLAFVRRTPRLSLLGDLG